MFDTYCVLLVPLAFVKVYCKVFNIWQSVKESKGSCLQDYLGEKWIHVLLKKMEKTEDMLTPKEGWCIFYCCGFAVVEIVALVQHRIVNTNTHKEK